MGMMNKVLCCSLVLTDSDVHMAASVPALNVKAFGDCERTRRTRSGVFRRKHLTQRRIARTPSATFEIPVNGDPI